mgnify:CR=1 FL=1
MDLYHLDPGSSHFYPRPPRGGRPWTCTILIRDQAISIHALREEGDGARNYGCDGPGAISIHALREEGDHIIHVPDKIPYVFLSTPSARRATHGSSTPARTARISIHALREEGDDVKELLPPAHSVISIHALREEGDG